MTSSPLFSGVGGFSAGLVPCFSPAGGVANDILETEKRGTKRIRKMRIDLLRPDFILPPPNCIISLPLLMKQREVILIQI
jgi:hypothetical protein